MDIINNQPDLPDTLTESSDCIEPAVKEKNVRRMTFILVFAIIFGIAAIWFMNKKSTPAVATAVMSDQQMQVEIAIAKLTGMKQEATGNVEAVVKKFYESADFKQVKTEKLIRNPFSHSWSLPLTEDGLDGILSTDTASSSSGKLELKSILESKYGNCCMINDSLLYEGDKIMSLTIVEIKQGFVKLKSETSDITLRFSAK